MTELQEKYKDDPAGRAEARKKLFADRLVNYVPLAARIKRVLDDRPTHRIVRRHARNPPHAASCAYGRMRPIRAALQATTVVVVVRDALAVVSVIASYSASEMRERSVCMNAV